MKKDITEIDKNFKLDTNIEQEGLVFFDAADEKFDLYGVYKTEQGFRRLPEDVAKATNEGTELLATNTAGGRLRFVTNSEFIAISCKIPSITRFQHMPQSGIAGFDVTVNGKLRGTFYPPLDLESKYEGIFHFEHADRKEILINFPLYNDVTEMFIGLQDTAYIEKAPKYTHEKPVVFYGSSITQGGCASRPGNSYEEILSEWLDCNYINLGFSGSARGEQAMAEYIASLDMSVFVMDYDHNAPTPEHLEKTHEPFYKIIREKNPDLPIVFVTGPNYYFWDGEPRRQIILKTYEKAKAAGDEKVWFVDGRELWGKEGWNHATMDGCHPSDLGFWRMAEGIRPALEEALKNY
ncbi:MAG: hypothetical protein E7397_04275 [Ruminococcaceae bacterium]|nr:hypothetical protein [Oscillospiraceae bacterium]